MDSYARIGVFRQLVVVTYVGDNNKVSRRGDLVRWVKDFAFYAADDKGNAWPHDPIYEYGLVMEVSHTDPNSVIVHGFTSKMLFIVDIEKDEIEIVSKATQRLWSPTPAEVKKYEK